MIICVNFFNCFFDKYCGRDDRTSVHGVVVLRAGDEDRRRTPPDQRQAHCSRASIQGHELVLVHEYSSRGDRRGIGCHGGVQVRSFDIFKSLDLHLIVFFSPFSDSFVFLFLFLFNCRNTVGGSAGTDKRRVLGLLLRLDCRLLCFLTHMDSVDVLCTKHGSSGRYLLPSRYAINVQS